MGRFVTLPAYIGAMLVAAVIRNVVDASRVVRVEQRVVDDIGTIALSLFLSMALMSLKLWELLDLALPMLVLLAVRTMMAAAFFATSPGRTTVGSRGSPVFRLCLLPAIGPDARRQVGASSSISTTR
jgi:hypothetical protein